MHESIEHRLLVLRGADYIVQRHNCGNKISIDKEKQLGAPKMISYMHYEPDIVAEHNNVLIIGEAKTEKDVLSSHSRRQYDEYLSYKDIDNRQVIFYLFVPWRVKPTANNYLKNQSKRIGATSVTWVVVSEVELAGI